MRSLRSVLPLAFLTACAAPVTAPAPVALAVAPAAAARVCQDEPQAEKAYYEAQRLFQKKRYWEAAPAFVISYNFCNHPQVLCAAGQAYRRAQKCGKSVELLQKCLASDVPSAARAQAEKLLAGAQTCEREASSVALRGDPADAAEPDDAAFGTQSWVGAGGKPTEGTPGGP